MSRLDRLTRLRRVDTGGPSLGKPVGLFFACAVPHEDTAEVARVVVPDRSCYDAPLLVVEISGEYGYHLTRCPQRVHCLPFAGGLC